MEDEPVPAADAVDPVPWAIHGAKHSADVARQNTYDSTGGAEGVSSPLALEVRATETPSEYVRVAPGGALLLSPFDEGQTYNFRVAKEALVPVPPSSSLSASTWYINAWINDPSKPGGTEPASVPFGPYASLTCDAAPKTDFPHYTPSKIVVPKSTAIVEDDYIEDLRELAQPRADAEGVYSRPRVWGDSGREEFLKYSVSSGGEYFPGGAGAANSFQWKIPRLCTRLVFDAAWMGVLYKANSNPYGLCWVEYGDEHSMTKWGPGQQYEFKTQEFPFDGPYASAMRDNWLLSDNRAVPERLRGKNCTFVFKAGLYNKSLDKTAVKMDYKSGLKLRLTPVQTISKTFEDAI